MLLLDIALVTLTTSVIHVTWNLTTTYMQAALPTQTEIGMVF